VTASRPDGTGDPTTPPAWHILLGVEGVLLLIAVAMTLTPGRTGPNWSPAELVFPEPTLVEDLAGQWILGNLVVAVLALTFLATQAVSRFRGGGPDDAGSGSGDAGGGSSQGGA